eukprot:gene14540-20580_t
METLYMEEVEALERVALEDTLKEIGFNLNPTEVQRLVNQLAREDVVTKSTFLASQLDWNSVQSEHADAWNMMAGEVFSNIDVDGDGLIHYADIMRVLDGIIPESEFDIAWNHVVDEAKIGNLSDAMDIEGFMHMLRRHSCDSLDMYDDCLSSGSSWDRSLDALGALGSRHSSSLTIDQLNALLASSVRSGGLYSAYMNEGSSHGRQQKAAAAMGDGSLDPSSNAVQGQGAGAAAAGPQDSGTAKAVFNFGAPGKRQPAGKAAATVTPATGAPVTELSKSVFDFDGHGERKPAGKAAATVTPATGEPVTELSKSVFDFDVQGERQPGGKATATVTAAKRKSATGTAKAVFNFDTGGGRQQQEKQKQDGSKIVFRFDDKGSKQQQQQEEEQRKKQAMMKTVFRFEDKGARQQQQEKQELKQASKVIFRCDDKGEKQEQQQQQASKTNFRFDDKGEKQEQQQQASKTNFRFDDKREKQDQQQASKTIFRFDGKGERKDRKQGKLEHERQEQLQKKMQASSAAFCFDDRRQQLTLQELASEGRQHASSLYKEETAQ